MFCTACGHSLGGDEEECCPRCAADLEEDIVGRPENVRPLVNVPLPFIMGGRLPMRLVGQSTETDIALPVKVIQTPVRETVAAAELQLRIMKPRDDAPDWTLQVWDDGDLIAQAPGASFDDAYLAVSDDVRDHLDEDD